MNVPFLLAQQAPIVVDTLRQPPVTPEISYGGMLLSAVGIVGVVLVGGLLTGLAAGGVIILLKKRRERNLPPSEPTHVRLRIEPPDA